MSTDQEFWENVAAPASRMLLQVALTKIEVTQAVRNEGKTVTQFAAELSADLADRLLLELTKRTAGPGGALEIEESP